MTGVLERSVQVLLAPPNRAMMVEKTTTQNSAERPLLPRISIYRLGAYTFPSSHWKTTKVRRLGWARAQFQKRLKIRQAKHPLPVRIPYQIDIWTETMREADLLIQYLVFLQGTSSEWLEIWAGDPWGWKVASLNFEGQVSDNTNLEALGRHDPVLIRKTIPFRIEGWVFDPFVQETDLARFFRVRVYDAATEAWMSDIYFPPRRSAGDGDGVETTFTVAAGYALQEYSVYVLTTLNGDVAFAAYDDGNGGWSTGTGSITYATGDLTITLPSPAKAGETVWVGYCSEA